ncbi:MAG: glycosyltransferase 87 family protein [Thermodesulfobacteriota bacterium]
MKQSIGTSRTDTHRLLTVLTLLIFCSYAVLAWLPDLRFHVPEMVGLTALITILLMGVAACTPRGQTGWGDWRLLGGAALLRLMFVCKAPTLSDDIYRYVLDGFMVLSGHNPYAMTPAGAAEAFPRWADLIANVNHPGFFTIYPPTAQIVFAVGALLGGVFGMKLLLSILDIATCFMLIRLLDRLGRPRKLAVLYAWHPLPVLEIAGSGHIDAAGICLVFAMILLVLRLTDAPSATAGSDKTAGVSTIRSPQPVYAAAAGLTAAAAVLVKLFPIFFMPGFLPGIKPAARRWFIAAAMIAGVLLTWPFVPDIFNAGQSLSAYLNTWEFSGFFFRSVRNISGSDRVARMIVTGAFIAITVALYVKLLVSFSRLRNNNTALGHILKTFYGISFAYMLTTPTLHPWYALYLVAFIPLAGGPAGIVFSWSVLLSYQVLQRYALTNQWIEQPMTALMIVSAPAAAVAVQWGIRRIQTVRGKASP